MSYLPGQSITTAGGRAGALTGDADMQGNPYVRFDSGALYSVPRTAIPGVLVHTFDNSGEAYDYSQGGDAVQDGDVLLVPQEGLAAVLCGAWPVAVNELADDARYGAFHRPVGGPEALAARDGGRYAGSVRVARDALTPRTPQDSAAGVGPAGMPGPTASPAPSGDTGDAASQPVTYTFDQISVTTIKVTTAAGEEAARLAAAALTDISVEARPGELEYAGEIAEGTTFNPTHMSPRGPAYLVEAIDMDGNDVRVSSAELFSEPISGDRREELAGLVAAWRTAADGPSADNEHTAAGALADAVSAILQPGQVPPHSRPPGLAGTERAAQVAPSGFPSANPLAGGVPVAGSPRRAPAAPAARAQPGRLRPPRH